MNNKHDYKIGNVYGCKKLLDLFKGKDGKTYAKTECVFCKKIQNVKPSSLFNEKHTSCLCRTKKHGMIKTQIYSAYHNMKYRCYTKTAHEFENYGGKGIRVCDEWLGENGFSNFYEWSKKNGFKEGLSIDRIDPNKNYCPDNCQWITRSENTIKANKDSQHRRANKGTYYGISPNGEYFEFENANKFGNDNCLNSGCIRKVANGNLRAYKGWKFGFVSDLKEESRYAKLP